MFSFNVCPFVSVVVSVALLSKTVAAYSNECYSNSDCDYGNCCTGVDPHVCSYNCVGKYCDSDSDCGGPNECCSSSSQCATDCSCDSYSDCRNGEKCCKESTGFSYERSFCNSSCLGTSCSSDSDCGDNGVTECCSSSGKCSDCPAQCLSNSDCSYGKYCCGAFSDYYGNCYSNCVGKSCSKNSPCGGPDECCDLFRCKTSNCPYKIPSWAIGLIIAGFFLVLLIPFAIYCCVVVWQSRSRGQLTEDNVLLIQPDSGVVSVQNYQDQSGPSCLPNRPPPYSFNTSETEAVSL